MTPPTVGPAGPANVVPDYCEALTGWRLWTVVPTYADVNKKQLVMARLKLRAGPSPTWPAYEPIEAVHDMTYAVAGVTSSCMESPCAIHIPHSKPGCGIYAFKNAQQLQRAYEQNSHTFWSCHCSNIVIGEVSLWGRIAEHACGYRAQFAYPKRFVYSPLSDASRLLSDYYGVPYEEDESWKLVCQSAESLQSLYGYQYLSIYPTPYQSAFLSRSPSQPSIPLLPRHRQPPTRSSCQFKSFYRYPPKEDDTK